MGAFTALSSIDVTNTANYASAQQVVDAAIDEVSNGGYGIFYNANSSINAQMNPFCLRCNNYGPADYDIRSSFNASYVWNTPWKFSNKWENGFMGGWGLSQNFFARTGLPTTIVDFQNPISNFTPNTGFNIASVVTGGQTGCNSTTTNVGTNSCFSANNFYQPVFDANGNLISTGCVIHTAYRLEDSEL